MSSEPRSKGRFLLPALAFGLLLAAGLLAAKGCNSSRPTPEPDHPPTADGPVWFEDVTDAWGLDFTHDPGPTGTFFMPQSMGSGVAVFDCDGDDLLDLYLLQFGGP